MLKVGITGGMGSGKSLVCKLFAALGVPVFDADRAAKKLMQQDPQVKAALITSFGANIYQKDGLLDRPKLAATVFNDPIALNNLNAITHPATIKAADNWMQELQQSMSPPSFVMKEAALLFEAHAEKGLDCIIGVFAPKEKRIDRIIKRDQTNREAILSRMDKQMDEERKMGLCDYILVNDELHLIWPAVLELHMTLENKARIASLKCK